MHLIECAVKYKIQCIPSLAVLQNCHLISKLNIKYLINLKQ